MGDEEDETRELEELEEDNLMEVLQRFCFLWRNWKG